MSIRIGVLSDSHGRRVRTALAVSRLRAAGADRLLHLGDFEDPDLFEELLVASSAGDAIPVDVVAGNMDDPQELAAVAARLGIAFHHPGGEIEIDGRRLAFTHGDRSREVDRLLASKPDYFLHGHTHQAFDGTARGVRTINPGALHRAASYTVVLLEPASGDATTIEIDRDG